MTIHCIPITASTGDGRAGGEGGADIQITKKMHRNRAFSMSIPCTHETYLGHRSLSRWVARRLVWRPGASLVPTFLLGGLKKKKKTKRKKRPFTVDSNTRRSHEYTGLT